MTEKAFITLKRPQNVVEERDSGFPAFRRNDANKWNRWEAYTTTFFTFPIRMFYACFMLATAALWSKLLRIGHDESKPLDPCRLTLMKGLYWFVCRSIIFLLWIELIYEDDPKKTTEIDYSYYLGKDYKKKQVLPK